MVDSPSAPERCCESPGEDDVYGAAEILSTGDGVSWAYRLLADVAERHQLSKAWLVLGPAGGTDRQAGTGSQVFGLGGAAVPPGTARALLERPPGVYGEPPGLTTTTSHALGAMCTMAFRAAAASLSTAVDPTSGLSTTAMIEGTIARATACGARYGWSSTLALLTTSGAAPADERWSALGAAVRQALRTGDEAGVAAPGVALAVLANAGSDAIRPFVARVRAALSTWGSTDVELHAATARTPEETVDPSELMRLATERLADARAASPSQAGAEPAAPVPDVASRLELELRMLPGVVCVGMGTPVVVVATSTSQLLYDQVQRLVVRRLPQASLRVLGPTDETATSGPASATGPPVHRSRWGIEGITGVRDAASQTIAATAPAAPGGAPGAAGAAGAARVVLLSAAFDVAHGTSEVSLAFGAARGTGRAPAGPLAGGAQATLNALSALSIDVPFYLASVEQAHGVPGQPVVVVLAPKRTGRDQGGQGGRPVERLGVASDPEDVVAASRATLGALNRHLARVPTVA